VSQPDLAGMSVTHANESAFGCFGPLAPWLVTHTIRFSQGWLLLRPSPQLFEKAVSELELENYIAHYYCFDMVYLSNGTWLVRKKIRKRKKKRNGDLALCGY
jgi:hypothetical protein